MNFKTLSQIAVAALVSAAVVHAEEKKVSRPDGLYVDMKTSKGTIVLAMEFEKVPMTVCNFVGLAEGKIANKALPAGQKYYDGLKFHRVIANFMIQGGDPKGNGTGGPGYNFPDEFDASLRHNGAGILSMANAGPGTNGSQFFITHNATPHLDDKHAVFGHVIEGQDVVNAIAQGDAIESITVERIGAAAEAFTADQAMFDSLLAGAEARRKAAMEKRKEELRMKNKASAEEMKAKYPKAEVTSSGLMYEVVKEGSGETPKQGQEVSVHYTGTLTNGNVFDSSRKRGRPIEFQVGLGEVIPGWDEALMGMKKGEQRTLIIPPDLGYGEQGYPPVIPRNAWLIFDVELVDFQ